MDKLTEELKNKYGTFTWWVNNDHWIEVEIPPELFEAFDSLLQKEREAGKREGIEEAIKEVEELEIRDDSGGDYMTSDTELMRTEVIETLLELKSQSVERSLQEKLEIDNFKFDKKGNSIP